MPLIEMTGNLFEIAGLDALAQGVNCEGVMDAGIAADFHRLWPEMFRSYRERCHGSGLRLGYIHTWLNLASGQWIYNLATQRWRGRHARVDAVQSVVEKMLHHAEEVGVGRIGMPRIGCGIGGLDYDSQVRPVLQAAADASPVSLIVVTPPPKQPHSPLDRVKARAAKEGRPLSGPEGLCDLLDVHLSPAERAQLRRG